MYELVLAVSFLTSACPTANVPSSPTVVASLVAQQYPGPRHDVSLVCGANWEITYRYVDTYRSYGECMKRVANIGEGDGVRGICRRARR